MRKAPAANEGLSKFNCHRQETRMLIRLICGLCNPSCVYPSHKTQSLEFDGQPVRDFLSNKLFERPKCCAADTTDSVSLCVGGAA